MNAFDKFNEKGVILIISILLLMPVFLLHGQGTGFSYYYRVYLKDKGPAVNNYALSDLLTPRAIERRQKTGIVTPDFTDIPVWKGYIDEIISAGFKLHCTSKWMNTALFKTEQPSNINAILGHPFIKEIKIVKTPGIKSNFNNKLDFDTVQSGLPLFERPVTMLNGNHLHNSGFDGKNIIIAILDGGFTNADQISSLIDFRRRGGIRATYDFVNNTNLVFNANTHGTAVLSILAGKIPGQLSGTAPAAEYLLLKTEDINSEFPCEEDFWAAGAEFADSAGADIITSSLGYFRFDDPSMDYKSSDIDGNTAFITKAADFAASKGILVINSAGNERDNPWHRIIFPSDGDSVISVGAVDGNNIVASFSSAGPSADNRIKPDIVTMGVSVPLQTSPGNVSRGNGTSFSCPVLSGMAACLMQAVPKALNQDIIESLHEGADRYHNPDSLYGYGIPDMSKTLLKLQEKYLKVPDEDVISYPNPTTGDFELIFSQPPGQLMIEILSMTGKLIYHIEYQEYAGRTIIMNALQNQEQGVYLIRISKARKTIVKKIIKLKDLL